MRWGSGTRTLSRPRMKKCASCSPMRWNMRAKSDDDLLRVVRSAARPLRGLDNDFDGLMRAIGSAQLVLIGEASHGTDEFYRTRAQMTKRLSEERDLNAV